MTTPQHPNQTEAVSSEPQVDTNKLVAERREKLAAIRAQGVAFPNDFKPADRAVNLHAAHDGTVSKLLASKGESLAVDQPILSFA